MAVVTLLHCWPLPVRVAMAQEKPTTGTNPLSVRGINENDIMMKKTLWRRIDLKEKQNQSMFSKNNEIYEVPDRSSMKAGLIDGYENDSVDDEADAGEIAEATNPCLILGGGLSAEEIAAGFGNETTAGGANDGWGDPKKTDPKKKTAAKPADDGWGSAERRLRLNPPMMAGDRRPRKRQLLKIRKGKKGSEDASRCRSYRYTLPLLK